MNQFVSNFLRPSGKKKSIKKNYSGKLSKYPKIRPAKKFLSFQDKDTRTKRFIPQARNIQSESDKQRFQELVGGRVSTRSSTRNSQSKIGADVNDDQAKKRSKGESSTRLNHESPGEKKKEILNEEKKKKKNEDYPTFKTEFERRKKEDENQNSADIDEHSILLFDVLLSGTTNLSADPKDTAKNLNQDYLRKLSFVNELFKEKAHSLR